MMPLVLALGAIAAAILDYRMAAAFTFALAVIVQGQINWNQARKRVDRQAARRRL